MNSVYVPGIRLPDNNVHGANMGSIWGQQGPGGPHVGPMNYAFWAIINNHGRIIVSWNL